METLTKSRLELNPVATMMDEFERALTVRGGDVWGWVELGVITGVTGNTEKGRKNLARKLGVIYHCSKRGDAQLTLEQLNMPKVAEMMYSSIEKARSIAEHASNMGLIASSVKQAELKRASEKL